METIKHLAEPQVEEYLAEIVDRFAGSELDRLAREHAAQRGISIPDKLPEPKVQTPGQEAQAEANNPWTRTLYILAGTAAAGVLIAA